MPPTILQSRPGLNLYLGLLVLVLPGCRAAEPAPSFALRFPNIAVPLLSNSSPNLIDLDGDGVRDIVFGTGVDRLRPERGRWRLAEEPLIAGYVTAVSGATNRTLWQAPHRGEAFTTPRFVHLNRDSVPDVLMGGRQGAFSALDGSTGKVLWGITPERIARTPVLYNFFTPALIGDINRDGVTDLVVAYGGDDTRLPGEARDPGFIVALSGADGAILATHKTPDGGETYSSMVVYRRADQTEWFIFGTGGERQGGAAYRAPVAALLDGSFSARAERLIAPGAKGVMAPATVVELTGDQEPDLVISTFDGRLIVLDGGSGRILWQKQEPFEESYHPAAVVRVSKEGKLGLFLSRGIGVFPKYAGSAHRLYDAVDGRLVYQYRDPLGPAGAPLAVDLTGDGIDEPFFFGARGRVNILYLPLRKLKIHDLPANLTATPHVAALGRRQLELIAVTWTNSSADGGLADWRNLHSELTRLDLNARAPGQLTWAAYMGTAADSHARN